ncbi:MAG: hypothetical protein GY862_11305, partial [Gammaproteobacteria bacterium]|nr:hypothetical protein [Gammaproteobacteria bacterium]
ACLVILDGLDEVTDPGLRTRVTERIQEMVSGYSGNRYLVTSRIIGYERSPMTREFKHATLKDLSGSDQTAAMSDPAAKLLIIPEVAADGVPTELYRAKMRQVQGGDSIQFEIFTVTGVP